MCGFYAAMDDTIVKHGAVVVYSIASPRVGNSDFRTTFQVLERSKRLQHLRIANKEDIVTHIPFVALEQVTLSPTSVLSQTSSGAVNLYKHCGVYLKLKAGNGDATDPKQLFTMSYARDKNDEDDGYVPSELKRSLAAGRTMMSILLATKADIKLVTNYHSCEQYERRLIQSRRHLPFQNLDELYGDVNMMGAAVACTWCDDKKANSSLSSSVQFLPNTKSPKQRNFV